MAKNNSIDATWMARALALARRGIGLASPNPAVGCVLVKNGRVAGQGYHRYAAKDHAEIVALRLAGQRARGATMYVTLEPCCITGRTGPCTRAIIAAGVRRVVTAMRDPNPRISGRGVAQLRRAGIAVTTGVLEPQARVLNAPFAKWIRTGLPYVTQKIAMTLDGRISSPNPRERWITSAAARREVHELRHAADAILTGIGTVLADDPRLTDRSGSPRRRPLLRVILDSRLRLPLRSKLVRSARGDVLVFTCAPPEGVRARRLRAAGVDLAHLRGPRPSLRAVLRELGRRGVLHVLLEAGATLNRAALRARIADRMVVYVAPRILGRGPQVVRGGLEGLQSSPVLHGITLRPVGRDTALEGTLRDVYRDY